MPPWERDEPIELSDGRLVCKLHHLTVCARCTVDYSFIQEQLAEEAAQRTRGTGAVVHNDLHMSGFIMEGDLPDCMQPERPQAQYRADSTTIVPNIRPFRPQNSTITPQELFLYKRSPAISIPDSYTKRTTTPFSFTQMACA